MVRIALTALALTVAAPAAFASDTAFANDTDGLSDAQMAKIHWAFAEALDATPSAHDLTDAQWVMIKTSYTTHDPAPSPIILAQR